jgi:hypothetical protein
MEPATCVIAELSRVLLATQMGSVLTVPEPPTGVPPPEAGGY